jgi:hypothetical protein
MSFSALRNKKFSRQTISLIAAFLVIAVTSSIAPQARAQVKTPKPPPDVLVFTNGDQLTGQLERGVANSVVFKSDVAGEVTVSLDKVKSLRASGNFAVLGKNAPISRKAVTPGAIQFSDKKLTVTLPQGPATTLPQDKIAFIIDQPTYNRELAKTPGPLYGWNGNVHGGATVVRSTNNGTTYNAGVSLVRAIPAVPFLPARNRTSFDLQETYGKLTSPVIPQTNPPSPPTVVLTSIFHTHAERDQYFSPQFFALTQTSYDHNYAQGLNLQQVYGGGIGWTTLKSGRQQMDVKADLHYEKQTFQTASSDQNLVGSTISEAYHRNLPRKLVVSQSVNVLPAWNNDRAYSANALVGLVMPVFKRLGLTVTSTDNFLNDPSAGYKKNSFQFVTAASYSLK